MLPRQTEDSKPRLTQRAAAAALGVSLWHLNRVLRGHRESRSLMRRYQELRDRYASGAHTPIPPPADKISSS